MYSFDPNINTAVERQADRLQAVRSYGSRQPAPLQTEDSYAQPARSSVKVKLTLAAAAPIAEVMAWVLVR